MKYMVNRFGLKCVVMLSIGLGAWTSGEALTLTWIYGSDTRWSRAYDVSADGSVVVGGYRGVSNDMAFRWESGVFQLIDGSTVCAYSVSSNGLVVVGEGILNRGSTWASQFAFRWTPTSGLLNISGGFAIEVSADGRTVVGYSGGWPGRAFRWTAQTGLQYLTEHPSEATAVSADGRIIFGSYSPTTGESRPFRWTAQGGFQDLSPVLGIGFYITACSADGSVIVGNQYTGGRHHSFRWHASTGKQPLGFLPGYTSLVAEDISADGNVIVGRAYAPQGSTAFLWTPQTGLVNLNLAYHHLLIDGSRLLAATAVSADGRYIVGYGYNFQRQREEAFLLDLQGVDGCVLHNPADVNSDGVVDDADLLNVLFNFGWQRCP